MGKRGSYVPKSKDFYRTMNGMLDIYDGWVGWIKFLDDNNDTHVALAKYDDLGCAFEVWYSETVKDGTWIRGSMVTSWLDGPVTRRQSDDQAI